MERFTRCSIQGAARPPYPSFGDTAQVYHPTTGVDMDSRTLRRRLVAGLLTDLRVIWPILSGLIV